MNLNVIATLTYGALTTIGGIMGYAQAHSKISLASGQGKRILIFPVAKKYNRNRP